MNIWKMKWKRNRVAFERGAVVQMLHTTDAICNRCYMQQIIEKIKEHNLPLFLLFIDYEKAYDNVNRDKLWEVMNNKIPNYLLNTIKCIYRNTKELNLMMVYLN